MALPPFTVPAVCASRIAVIPDTIPLLPIFSIDQTSQKDKGSCKNDTFCSCLIFAKNASWNHNRIRGNWFLKKWFCQIFVYEQEYYPKVTTARKKHWNKNRKFWWLQMDSGMKWHYGCWKQNFHARKCWNGWIRKPDTVLPCRSIPIQNNGFLSSGTNSTGNWQSSPTANNNILFCFRSYMP